MKQLYFILTVATSALFMTAPAHSQLSKSVGLLKGDVVSNSGEHLTGLNVIILKGTERVTSTKSNTDGKFTAILQPNATYRVAINSNEYGYHEDTIVVPSLDHYQEFPLHVVLIALHDGQMLTLDKPVFLTKSSLIESPAIADLEKIADLMHHNNKVSVSITVYPDAPIKSKKDPAEQQLVGSRATAVRSFFLGKNIPANRITVLTGSTVPPGRFASSHSVAETPSTSSGKKKKKQSEAKPGLMPQYMEIVAHLAS